MRSELCFAKSDYQIYRLAVLQDNYTFILKSKSSPWVAVIDPAESVLLHQELCEHGWRLAFILNTHHHADHVGGNIELKKFWACQILANQFDSYRIPGSNRLLKDGELFEILNLSCLVKQLDGHTLGHVAYYFESLGVLFVGDTLFSLGCGRLFEGTPAQLWQSLRWIRSLPTDTTIFCAHEYTQKNLAFVFSLRNPDEEFLKKAGEIRKACALGRATVPFSLEEELRFNPFLKVDDNDFAQQIGLAHLSELDRFIYLREARNRF